MTYADNIGMMARSQTALKEVFSSLERAAGVMGVKINKEKTKYLTTRGNENQPKHIQLRTLILKQYRVLHTWAPL